MTLIPLSRPCSVQPHQYSAAERAWISALEQLVEKKSDTLFRFSGTRCAYPLPRLSATVHLSRCLARQNFVNAPQALHVFGLLQCILNASQALHVFRFLQCILQQMKGHEHRKRRFHASGYNDGFVLTQYISLRKGRQLILHTKPNIQASSPMITPSFLFG